MTEPTTPPAGQDAAGHQIVQIDPIAELGELQWLLSCYRNRNLILANERHLLNATVNQQKSLIEHLKGGKG
jgi:hypothetical protein